eukprot:TRINITY_DN4112_c0_g4_i1.p1 TRINITY_DN4112_c0_g4~~TRINITY_DN4112_c0_g4_i1.p1  ORF type:complete len:431 (+),score=132.31 TRINITY_DN4112_c0_g4_i1:75-1367(+)
MAAQFLDAVKAKPEETVKAFLEEIKLHRERHIKSKHDQEKQWKELCEKNYSKSLDHRAFYFKQGEKKSTNTKSFCADIKQRFDTRSLDATSEPVKRGGTPTSIYYSSFTMLPPENFHVQPVEGDEVAALSSEQVARFAAKLPQYQMRFDNVDAFGDAYRVVLHQILNGHASQTEKDKARNMLDSLMENFIELDVKSFSSDDIEEFSEDDIKTLMDENTLLKRMEQLDLDIPAFLEKLKADVMKSNGEEKGQKPKAARQSKTNRGGYNKRMEGAKIPQVLDRGLTHNEHNGLPMEFERESDQSMESAMFLPAGKNVFYTNANFYSFFRHFYCLYERLIKAKALSGEEIETQIKNKTNLEAKYTEKWKEKKDELKIEVYKQIYLKGLYSLLSSTIDTAKYEDFCRHYLGTQAYLLFSIDKLINSVRGYVLNG